MSLKNLLLKLKRQPDFLLAIGILSKSRDLLAVSYRKYVE